MKYIKVGVPISNIDLLTYKSDFDDIKIGQRVSVYVRNRLYQGIIFELLENKPNFECREVVGIIDKEPIFDLNYLKMIKWMSLYYNNSVGTTIKALFPSEFFFITDFKITLNNGKSFNTKSKKIKKLINELSYNELFFSDIKKKFNISFNYLKELEKEGVINLHPFNKNKMKFKTKTVYKLNLQNRDIFNDKEFARRYPGQYKVLLYLKDKEYAFFDELNASYHTIKKLIENGLIIKDEMKIERRFSDSIKYDFEVEEPELTEYQKKAIEQIEPFIENSKFSTFLLYGVTGSGKTEVYLRLAKKVLEKGKSILVLVPEISLTPKLTYLFKQRLGENIEVLHSKISSGEKYDTWNRIFSKNKVVVIGARSAIFAPIKNPGLIIIDEEHEQTYKQSSGAPFYNARDIAIVKAKIENIPIVLGSATPSLESYYNAIREKYFYLKLPERVNKKELPEVILYDLKEKNNSLIGGFLSTELYFMIKARLERNEQVILFLNRRGYSPFFICKDCGEIIKCPNCDISLTYHKTTNKLVCHYCDYQLDIPDKCPSCNSQHISYKGFGSQRIEEKLQKIFPQAKIKRMDSDTTQNKNSHYKILKDFEEKKYDILIGTQMITKGLDFPDVTLVGILFADIGLNMPDFRAIEKTFSQLTQVIGRAGRSNKKGIALIQTYQPENYGLRFAKSQFFEEFAKFELKIRKEFEYPPFIRLILIKIFGEDLKYVTDISNMIADILKKESNGLYKILGPVEAPLAKINKNYYFHIILKTHDVFKTNNIFNNSLKRVKNLNLDKVRIHYVVDPISML